MPDQRHPHLFVIPNINIPTPFRTPFMWLSTADATPYETCQIPRHFDHRESLKAAEEIRYVDEPELTVAVADEVRKPGWPIGVRAPCQLVAEIWQCEEAADEDGAVLRLDGCEVAGFFVEADDFIGP